MSIVLKDAEFRHNSDGERVVTATLYADSLTNLPTDASDIDGLMEDDVLASGSTAIDMTSGAVAMYDGSSWSAWG